MFVREAKRLTIPISPSYLSNNLSSSIHDNLAVVKGSEVHVLRLTGDSNKVDVPAKAKISQAKYLDLARTSLLAVTSDQGLQLWSAEGNSLLFNYPVSEAVPDSDEIKFVRGVACSGKDVVVGASNGHVLVFDASDAVHGGAVTLVHRLDTQQRQPVLAVAASSAVVAVADAHGSIFVYNAREAYAQVAVFAGQGVPVTALAAVEDVVVAGYSTGHIRVYRTDDVHELAVEIAAHTRAVTALAVHAPTQLVASVSADSHVHVWSMPTFRSAANSTVNCVFSDLVEHRLCTGVAFVGETRLCVASYDEEELVVYQRV